MGQKITAEQAEQAQVQQPLDEELRTLQIQRKRERDNVILKHMRQTAELTTSEPDLERYSQLEEAKNKKLKRINTLYDAKERALKDNSSPAPKLKEKEARFSSIPPPTLKPSSDERHSPATHIHKVKKVADSAALASSASPSISQNPYPQTSHTHAPPVASTASDRDSSLPLVAKAPSVQVRSQLLDAQNRLMVTFSGRGLPQHQKRRAPSVESAPPDHAKRPRLDDGEGKQQTECGTITYQEVRRRATQESFWDTIVEWPNKSSVFYVLYCEEHGVNFKKFAVQAAAKHMNSNLHNIPNRDQALAVEKFGRRVLDCNNHLMTQHNDEVEQAYKKGYIPRNNVNHGCKGGKKVKYPFNDDDAEFQPHPSSEELFQESSLTTNIVQRQASRSKAKIIDLPLPKKHCMTNVKPFHIYNCNYNEGDDDENGAKKITVWPVVILGWDDLTPGAMREDSLVDTGLLNQSSKPPGCYVYSDRNDKILGWKTGPDGKPKTRDSAKKYPVMFFDEEYSYSWVPATDLSRFELYRKNAPKIKGYKEKAFNEARGFIARREGYECWQAREAARASGQWKEWYPGMPRAASSFPVWSDMDHTEEEAAESQDSPDGAVNQIATDMATSTISESHHAKDMSAARQLADEAASPEFPNNESADPHFPLNGSKIDGGKAQAAGQEETSLPMFELRPVGRKLTAKRTMKRPLNPETALAPISPNATTPAEILTPTETPAMSPDKPVVEVSTAVNNPDANPLFELSSYHADDGSHWDWENADAGGIKLFQEALPSKLRSHGGSTIDINIDAAVWECLEVQKIPGNTQITLCTKDKKVRLVFDRKHGDLTMPHGKRQARSFIDWIRTKRNELGLQLQTKSS
ncbi:hypothetical protein E8E14_008937 [Neopestalotiopsis sp. 37M]|nr:hypothetical protein E8E14_008937 [Neopestalotiopsis sp. 37M]